MIPRQTTTFKANAQLSARSRRAARLESLPDWAWDPLDATWEAAFSALERFVAREHHARVPVLHVEEGSRLGRWINVQRNAYGSGRMAPERAARLEALPGWVWHARKRV